MSEYPRQQWEAIKALSVQPRMTHVSKTFFVNPLATLAEQANEPFCGPRYLPNKGVTLNKGRNQRKREERAGLSRKHWPTVQ